MGILILIFGNMHASVPWLDLGLLYITLLFMLCKGRNHVPPPIPRTIATHMMKWINGTNSTKVFSMPKKK